MAHKKRTKKEELACCDEETQTCEPCDLEEYLEKNK